MLHIFRSGHTLLFSLTTPLNYQRNSYSMAFNFRLFLSSALVLLVIATIASADSEQSYLSGNGQTGSSVDRRIEGRQIDSIFNSLTGDVGSVVSSLTNDVASGWREGTSFLGSLGDGVYGTLTSVGGSLYTILSSEGGDVVTLAGNLPGVVTSFAGEQITILTSVAGGSLPTKNNNDNAALPRSSISLLDIALALGGVALGALITLM